MSSVLPPSRIVVHRERRWYRRSSTVSTVAYDDRTLLYRRCEADAGDDELVRRQRRLVYVSGLWASPGPNPGVVNWMTPALSSRRVGVGKGDRHTAEAADTADRRGSPSIHDRPPPVPAMVIVSGLFGPR